MSGAAYVVPDAAEIKVLPLPALSIVLKGWGGRREAGKVITKHFSPARWALLAVGGLLALAAVVNLARILATKNLETLDFPFIWKAGAMWRAGLDPYSPTFQAAGSPAFGGHAPLTGWFYPFHWYLPAVLTASVSPLVAYRCWVVLTLAATLFAGWLASRVARDCGSRVALSWLVLLCGYALSTTALTAVLRTGQPAVPAMIGLPIAALGMLRGRNSLVMVGAALLMLKPQFGIPAVFAMMVLPGCFWGVVAGGVLTCILSLPAFFTADGLDAISFFLANATGGHGHFEYNQPAYTTGLTHILYRAFNIDIPLSQSLGVAAAASAALALIWRRKAPDPQSSATLIMVAVPLVIACFVTLHLYDLSILLFALPWLGLPSGRATTVIALGYILLWRPENVRPLIGGDEVTVASLGTAAVLIILAGWLLAWIDVRRAQPTARLRSARG